MTTKSTKDSTHVDDKDWGKDDPRQQSQVPANLAATF